MAWLSRCQCEHESHTEPPETDHPDHLYCAEVSSVVEVRTIYGVFWMCQPCARAVPKEDRAGPKDYVA